MLFSTYKFWINAFYRSVFDPFHFLYSLGHSIRLFLAFSMPTTMLFRFLMRSYDFCRCLCGPTTQKALFGNIFAFWSCLAPKSDAKDPLGQLLQILSPTSAF